MNDAQLLRYARHLLLDEIGLEGQQRVIDSTALIIGIGGLGSPAAMYLAASGVGRLILCDPDTVDLSNLQRQIVHRSATIGQPKVESARQVLQDINPEVECVTLSRRLDETSLAPWVAQADVVLDCSDNFATRYAVNRVCHAARKPLVSGAAIQLQGQISVFDFARAPAPCYHCLFPEDSEAAELRCATTGVLAPLVGVIGSLQATEALKLLAGIQQGLQARLLAMDALDMRLMQSRIAPDPACPVCRGDT